jgi:hypothetical protein
MVNNVKEKQMSYAQQTGSLVNHLHARGVVGQPTPVVGMGATLLSYTDRHGATIIDVQTIRGVTYITVQEDNSVRIDKNGMSESQEYEYTRDPNGRTETFRTAKNGMWERVYKNPETNRWNRSSTGGVRIGDRNTYHDFSF